MTKKKTLPIQAELEASQAYYFDLYDQAPVGYILLNERGLILEANLSAAALLGMAKDALVGQPLSRFVLPDDQELYDQHSKHLIETGAPQVCELRLGRADGSQLWVWMNTSMGQGAEGAPVYRSVLHDTTERKQKEDALKKSETQYRLLAEHVTDIIWMMDMDMHLTYISPAVKSFSGYSAAELMAQGPDEILTPASRETFLQLWAEGPAQGQNGLWNPQQGFQVELEFCCKDGSTVWGESLVSYMADMTGSPMTILGSTRNITARKQAEMALQSAHEELKHRTAEIQQAHVERDKLLEDLTHQNLQLQTVAEISRSAAASLDLDYLIQRSVDLIYGKFGFYFAGIYLTDEQNKYDDLCAATGESGQLLLARKHRLAVGGNSMIGWCIANARARIALDVAQETIRFKNPFLPDTRSEMALPLLGRERCIGARSVQSAGEQPFTDRDITILQTMADQLATAIENARLYTALQMKLSEHKQAEKDLQHYVNELEVLYAVAAAASAFLDPIVLLTTTLENVMENIDIDADAGWVIMPDDLPERQQQVVVSRGISSAFLSPKAPAGLGDHSNLRLWSNATRPAAGATRSSELYYLPDELAQAGLQNGVDIPLTAGQHLLGFMSIAWKAAKPHFAINYDLLLAIGRQIGMALRNTQLYRAARQVNLLKVLNAIGTAASSTLELNILLHEVLQITCQALNASDGSILLRDSDTEELIFSMALTDASEVLSGHRIPKGHGIAGWVVEHRQTVRVNNVAEDPRWYRDFDNIVGYSTRSLLAAPLVYRDIITGVIEVTNKVQGEFTEEDANLLEAVSAISSAALENARLFASTLARADELQLLYDERARIQAHMIQTEKVAALGRLAASIAHEINNPLQAIQGCLTLFTEEMNGSQRHDKLSRYLGIVESEIDRVAVIVSRMRDFSRPLREETSPTYIISALESVLDLSAKQLQHNNISVERIWPDEFPVIEANPGALRQVFLNLVLNAIDAMPNGGRLRVLVGLDQMSRGRPPQPAIRIEFGDSGRGMSQQTLAHLFEPFFTTKENGTGLGLYISHEIITSHHGEIAVSSEIGIGTTFVILLPLERV